MKQGFLRITVLAVFTIFAVPEVEATVFDSLKKKVKSFLKKNESQNAQTDQVQEDSVFGRYAKNVKKVYVQDKQSLKDKFDSFCQKQPIAKASSWVQENQGASLILSGVAVTVLHRPLLYLSKVGFNAVPWWIKVPAGIVLVQAARKTYAESK